MNVVYDGPMTNVLDTNSHNTVLHCSKKACQPSTHLKVLHCYFVVGTIYELCLLLKRLPLIHLILSKLKRCLTL